MQLADSELAFADFESTLVVDSFPTITLNFRSYNFLDDHYLIYLHRRVQFTGFIKYLRWI